MNRKSTKMASSPKGTRCPGTDIQISTHMFDQFIIENKHDQRKKTKRDEISKQMKGFPLKYMDAVCERRRGRYTNLCLCV